MLFQLIRSGIRSLKKNSSFTLLNVAGLSISLCVTIVLFLFIVREAEFDRYNSRLPQIYRVLNHATVSGEKETWCTSPNALAPAMKSAIPDIAYATRVLRHGFGSPALLATGRQLFSEKNFYYCDADFLQIFDVPFEEGDPRTALARPKTIVISHTLAHRLFGNEAAVGKAITVDGKVLLQITGVFRDFPTNSSFDCAAIASFLSSGFSENLTWDNVSFETYCLVTGDAPKSGVEKAIQTLVKKNSPEPNPWFTINSSSLQPFGEVHLYSSAYKNSYITRTGSIGEIKDFSFLALLILLIACINYMNLATAQFQKRTKEISLNKVLGASTATMLLRYYVETAILLLLAILSGLLLAFFAIPLFNSLTGKNLQYRDLLMPAFFFSLAAVWLVTTLIAGSYPAISAAVQNPLNLMRSSRIRNTGANMIRKLLVVSQLSASIVLIIFGLTIYRQLDFMRHTDLGYNPRDVIAIALPPDANMAQAGLAIDDLKKLSFVVSGSVVQGFPGKEVSGRKLFKAAGDQQGLDIQTNSANNKVLDVLEVKLLAGSPLPANIAPGDTTVRVLLNKNAVDYLGYTPQQAIGKKVNMMLGDNAYIVGVMDNFHFSSLQFPVGSYAFYADNQPSANYILLRCAPGERTMVYDQLQSRFKRIFPASIFECTFLSTFLADLYSDQVRTGKTILFFAILAIAIACLGLFGLTAYSAGQKTREIGIRKVLGSNVFSIVRLLSADYIRMFLLSSLIAIPAGAWLSSIWLRNFAYRTNIDYWLLALACISLLGITLMTISFQTIRAAMQKPARSLRNE